MGPTDFQGTLTSRILIVLLFRLVRCFGSLEIWMKVGLPSAAPGAPKCIRSLSLNSTLVTIFHIFRVSGDLATCRRRVSYHLKRSEAPK